MGGRGEGEADREGRRKEEDMEEDWRCNGGRREARRTRGSEGEGGYSREKPYSWSGEGWTRRREGLRRGIVREQWEVAGKEDQSRGGREGEAVSGQRG